VPKFNVSAPNLNNALDQLSFIPIQITSALADSGREIIDQVDVILEYDSESASISFDSDGSFEINGNTYYYDNINNIESCARESISSNLDFKTRMK
jgi:hypothetical protein